MAYEIWIIVLYENINIIRKYFSSDEMCIEGFASGLQL